VGSGAINAATYNAFQRGITMRAVADKARNKGDYSYQALVVRKDLWDSGAVRSLRDLKGRKFVTTANGANEAAVIEEALRSVGLTSADLDMSLLSMPQQVAAYASGALDARQRFVYAAAAIHPLVVPSSDAQEPRQSLWRVILPVPRLACRIPHPVVHHQFRLGLVAVGAGGAVRNKARNSREARYTTAKMANRSNGETGRAPASAD
jgi:hypothetical protein